VAGLNVECTFPGLITVAVPASSRARTCHWRCHQLRNCGRRMRPLARKRARLQAVESLERRAQERVAAIHQARCVQVDATMGVGHRQPLRHVGRGGQRRPSPSTPSRRLLGRSPAATPPAPLQRWAGRTRPRRPSAASQDRRRGGPPAASQSTMPTHLSPVHRVLPCHRSHGPTRSHPAAPGTWLTRSSATSSNGEDPDVRRLAAKSTSASGRVRSGRLGHGAVAAVWSAAAAAPQAPQPRRGRDGGDGAAAGQDRHQQGGPPGSGAVKVDGDQPWRKAKDASPFGVSGGCARCRCISGSRAAPALWLGSVLPAADRLCTDSDTSP
jgi:hypothetical protein